MKAARIPLALALLLLILCHEVAAQEHQEFSIPKEMEDSLSSLSIKPVEAEGQAPDGTLLWGQKGME